MTELLTSAEQSVATTHLWHPFSDMAAVREAEIVMARGEGVWLWDEEGRRYLDGTASLWYANVGHGRREIADAIAAQMTQLETYSIFGDLANRPALDLADRLSSLAPMDDARVFFTSGGGEAIETASKLARLYWQAQGAPDRVHIVSRSHAYHGSHGFGTSLGGIEPNRAGFGPLVPATTQVPHDSVDALERTLAELGAHNVAAFVFEPVIGAGGVIAPPPDYLEGVTELCQSLGVLVVCDAVICGFGRLGTWFGCERYGIEPDMITFAKGVTSGYLPLGGLLASSRVAEPFWGTPGRQPFRHGPTYAGHAACCAAGLANLDIIEREGLLTQGQRARGRSVRRPGAARRPSARRRGARRHGAPGRSGAESGVPREGARRTLEDLRRDPRGRGALPRARPLGRRLPPAHHQPPRDPADRRRIPVRARLSRRASLGPS